MDFSSVLEGHEQRDQIMCLSKYDPCDKDTMPVTFMNHERTSNLLHCKVCWGCVFNGHSRKTTVQKLVFDMVKNYRALRSGDKNVK